MLAGETGVKKFKTLFKTFLLRQVARKTIADKRLNVRRKLFQKFAPHNFDRALTAII